jgi:tetratricopeptide (TPR) repeat protein
MINTFWTYHDSFKKAVKTGNIDEARRLLYAMTQCYPQMSDNDLEANKAIIHDALSLDKVIVNFNLAFFVPYAMRLADSDWEGIRHNGRIVPSLGQRITNRLMTGISERSDDYIKGVMPFFRKALQINPSNKDNLRHLAQLYARVKLKSQAVGLYKRLLQRYHDSYLYAELAKLMTSPKDKVALLCEAIVHQPKEAFNVANRYHLATLLQMPEPTRAAYEIRKSISARKKAKLSIPADVERVGRILAPYEPVTEAEQLLFYQRQAAIAQRIILQP